MHTDDPGYTEDATRNKMLRHSESSCMKDRHVRFDRILVNRPQGEIRATYCNTEQIELLGTAGITDSLWVSDHFGLYAEIGLGTNT